MVKFTLIQDQSELILLIDKLNHLKTIAIDIECENNLHHYGAYVTLIQISDGENSWIIDALRLDIKPFIKILENSKIQKVFHDISFDLRIIQSQYHCRVSNIFDTQIAANFLGKEKVGLTSLLEEYFEVKKERKFQRFDWTRRPLSKAMLAYAAQDAAFLLQLKAKLEKGLQDHNRLEWVQEECSNLENVDWQYTEQDDRGISGVKSLSGQERAIFSVLFTERKRLAKNVDKPPFMIYSNKQMLSLAKKPPKDWILVKGVHTIVAENALRLFQLVSEASQRIEELPRNNQPRLSLKQHDWTKSLLELRNKVANNIPLKPHLLLNNDQMRDIAVTQSLDCLRNWQKELLHDQKLVLEILRD